MIPQYTESITGWRDSCIGCLLLCVGYDHENWYTLSLEQLSATQWVDVNMIHWASVLCPGKIPRVRYCMIYVFVWTDLV